MKKLGRKLVLSMIAVLFAVITLGTSTYAWLSMNTQVTATGMQVTAKTDSKYLLIGTGEAQDTYQEIQAINPAPSTVALTVDAADSQVFPCAHRATGDDITLAGSAVVSDTTTASAVANWYYRTADLPTASTSTTAAVALTTFTNYVIHKTVYITVSQGSTPVTNLKVSGTFAVNNSKTGQSETFEPVRCLVTTSTATAELSQAAPSSDTVLAAEITDTTCIQVDIFIYYDGNSTNVYTTNVANLEGATVDLAFTVE